MTPRKEMLFLILYFAICFCMFSAETGVTPRETSLNSSSSSKIAAQSTNKGAIPPKGYMSKAEYMAFAEKELAKIEDIDIEMSVEDKAILATKIFMALGIESIKGKPEKLSKNDFISSELAKARNSKEYTDKSKQIEINAERLYSVKKKGDPISIYTKTGKHYEGKFYGKTKSYITIDDHRVSLMDLSEDSLDLFSESAMSKKRADYVRREKQRLLPDTYELNERYKKVETQALKKNFKDGYILFDGEWVSVKTIAVSSIDTKIQQRKKRIAEEAERKRIAEEAERKRLAEEAERKRIAEEAERKRIAEEAERKRIAEEAERKRLAEEAERKRIAEEAERKRIAEDEADRQNEEIAYSSQSVVLPPGSPSELLLKYVEMGETAYVAEVLKQNPSFDVDRPRATGNKTTLYLACEKGYEDVVKLLLKHKADATICASKAENGILDIIQDESGYNSLTIAAKNGHLATVKILLESGIGIEVQDEENRTPLYAAAANNKPIVVEYLCESKAAVNSYGRNGWTPLTVAASNGYTEIVQVLLKYGADLEIARKTEKGSSTATYIASVENHPDIVEILCRAGAKVNMFGNNGWTPLTAAASNGYTEIVQVLLKYGADLEMRNQPSIGGGDTPLYHAANNNHPETVEILCKAEADMDATTGSLGDPPLIRAVKSGYIEVIKVLLKYGANQFPYDYNKHRYDKSAIEVAERYKRQDIVDLLKYPPDSWENDSQQSVSSRNLEATHKQVMKSINYIQSGKNNGETNDDYVARMQSARSKLQQKMVAQNAPDDYINAVLDMLTAQINCLISAVIMTQNPNSPGYSNISTKERQAIASRSSKTAKDLVNSYKDLNKVLRKYRLKEINDTSGRF